MLRMLRMLRLNIVRARCFSQKSSRPRSLLMATSHIMVERGMGESHCPRDMGVISPSPFRFQLGKRPISEADWRLVQAFDPNRTVRHTVLNNLFRMNIA
jgi:hypothetical protein